MDFDLQDHSHRLSANFGLFRNRPNKQIIDGFAEKRYPPPKMMGFKGAFEVKFHVLLNDVVVVQILAEQHHFPKIS